MPSGSPDDRPNLKRPRFSNEIATQEIIDQTRFHGFITTIRYRIDYTV